MAEVMKVALMEQNTSMCSDPTVWKEWGGGISYIIEEDLLCARPCAGDPRTRTLAPTIRRTWQTGVVPIPDTCKCWDRDMGWGGFGRTSQRRFPEVRLQG